MQLTFSPKPLSHPGKHCSTYYETKQCIYVTGDCLLILLSCFFPLLSSSQNIGLIALLLFKNSLTVHGIFLPIHVGLIHFTGSLFWFSLPLIFSVSWFSPPSHTLWRSHRSGQLEAFPQGGKQMVCSTVEKKERMAADGALTVQHCAEKTGFRMISWSELGNHHPEKIPINPSLSSQSQVM